MDKANTNRVGALLTRAREEGELPWEWIVQEGREIERLPSWDSPAEYARAVQASYRLNKWAGQPKRIIVVSEKGTIRGTLEPVLREFEVDFLPVGGYASATRVNDLAQQRDAKRPLLVLYLGDHDPSGRGMSDRDLPQRLLQRQGVLFANIAAQHPRIAPCGSRVSLTVFHNPVACNHHVRIGHRQPHHRFGNAVNRHHAARLPVSFKALFRQPFPGCGPLQVMESDTALVGLPSGVKNG